MAKDPQINEDELDKEVVIEEAGVEEQTEASSEETSDPSAEEAPPEKQEEEVDKLGEELEKGEPSLTDLAPDEAPRSVRIQRIVDSNKK